jgi:hypothetical protein
MFASVQECARANKQRSDTCETEYDGSIASSTEMTIPHLDAGRQRRRKPMHAHACTNGHKAAAMERAQSELMLGARACTHERLSLSRDRAIAELREEQHWGLRGSIGRRRRGTAYGMRRRADAGAQGRRRGCKADAEAQLSAVGGRRNGAWTFRYGRHAQAKPDDHSIEVRIAEADRLQCGAQSVGHR